MEIAINIRASQFFAAQTLGPCSACNALTAVVGIAVPAGHETLDNDDDDDYRGGGSDRDGGGDCDPADKGRRVRWSSASQPAFLFYLEWLPPSVHRRLTQFAPSFRRSMDTSGAEFWANHCESCGMLLDDQGIFCEPEGAFAPVDAESAALIHLLLIEEAFSAASGGYAFEPPFFDSMTRG